MRFPFKIFWHIIPYLFCMAISWDSPLYLKMFLFVAFSISILKADFFIRFQNKIVPYTMAFIECVFLIFILNQLNLPLAYASIVPTIDFLWYQPQKSKRQLGIIFTYAMIILLISYNSNPIFALGTILSSIWIGSALSVMEYKKESAQQYYDRLRISEEALKKANADLEAYYETIEEVTQLRERTRISREIHDGVGHALSTTLIQLQAIEMRLEQCENENAAHIARLADFIRDALENTRNIVHAMGNQAQKEKQFKHEIAELCHKFSTFTGVKIAVTQTENFPSITTMQSEALFRVTQECLTNSVKHGKATTIKIVLSSTDKNILLTISDNGLGAESHQEGFGLTQMKNRISELHGHLQYESQINNGFTTYITIPREVTNEITTCR